jgi:hypothetical protein
MEAEGGIVFYVDETGQNGFVVTMEDLGQFAWGCSGTNLSEAANLSGADGQAIGTGYQNTLDIVSGCSETPIAASEALAYESEGYSDWYLPSKDELFEMYNTIGNGGPEGNIGGFENNLYWSSSENYDGSVAWGVNFGNGGTGGYYKDYTGRIRPIRAFGYTLGCMDETACNFSAEANMADDSCVYPEQGYDCDGNITAEIGDIMEGGYLFYIDETGQHGLVAALEDLGQFEWGCSLVDIEGADGTAIGTGYQNTLEIVSGCSETPIAASEALAYESNGFDDWYLPSIDELHEMYNTIGQGGSEGNIGGFEIYLYWSSSEDNSGSAWGVYFYNGTGYGNLNSAYRVRVIRAF